jgi:preprotein translocase subunit YajC
LEVVVLDLFMLFPIVMCAAFYYFFLVRPRRADAKKREDMLMALKLGDTVTTIGGIIGNVVFSDDNSVVIESSGDQVRIKVTKWAIRSVGTIPDGAED